VFAFFDGDGNDTIKDFKDGVDKIDLQECLLPIS
jgi:hypothetical protein